MIKSMSRFQGEVARPMQVLAKFEHGGQSGFKLEKSPLKSHSKARVKLSIYQHRKLHLVDDTFHNAGHSNME